MNVLKLRAVPALTPSGAAGESRAIIGPNAAGKTSVFNLLSRLLAPTAGSIIFKGTDITSMPAHQRVSLGIARTFQVTEVFPELTERDNLGIAVKTAVGLRWRLCGGAATRARVGRRIDEVLAATGLTAKQDRLVGELAHGDLTIVLIEHDMRVVFDLAGRITVLDQGGVLAEGPPEQIAANAAVQAAYLGKAA